MTAGTTLLWARPAYAILDERAVLPPTTACDDIGSLDYVWRFGIRSHAFEVYFQRARI